MNRDQSLDSAPVAFLFGFERSGTTLLSMMVGAHPEVAVPLSATGLWYRYARKLLDYNELRTATDVERLVDDLLHEERIRLWDTDLTREEVLSGLRPGNFAAVFARFHSLYASRKGKPRWGNIDIDTLEEMDVAYRWFPNAKFLHIVRDGRDVALSHETYAYGAANIGECADRWSRWLQVNLKMGAILGPERYYVVRYEDLILTPEQSLRRICAFLELAYSPRMLAYPEMVSEKIPSDRRWLWPLLDRPPDKTNVDRWKHQMRETQRVVFERTAGPMLAQLGYETYARIPKMFGAHLLELWYFLGQGGRIRRLATRAGLRRDPGRRGTGRQARALG